MDAQVTKRCFVIKRHSETEYTVLILDYSSPILMIRLRFVSYVHAFKLDHVSFNFICAVINNLLNIRSVDAAAQEFRAGDECPCGILLYCESHCVLVIPLTAGRLRLDAIGRTSVVPLDIAYLKWGCWQ